MKKILKKFRLPIKIIKTQIREHFYYGFRLVASMMTTIARCGILLILYWYVYRLNNGVINGTTFLFAAWSIFFYFAFLTLQLRTISKLIMQDVQSGNVEILFSKPISYLSYRMWWQVGSGLYYFIVTTILGIIALAFFIGFPATMNIGLFIPTLILTFICGCILSLFIYSIVGLFSFWVEDINPIYWIVDKIIMILGGSFLPIALFPALMYKISLFSPFGAANMVTHTVYESWQTNWYQLVGVQLFWIIVLGLITYFMFKKAKEKVSVNGG